MKKKIISGVIAISGCIMIASAQDIKLANVF